VEGHLEGVCGLEVLGVGFVRVGSLCVWVV
jgi:hypothetical protein